MIVQCQRRTFGPDRLPAVDDRDIITDYIADTREAYKGTVANKDRAIS